jgi:hypothetical protein
MTTVEYAKHKRQISALLRNPKDEPPVCNVLPGDLESHDAARKISKLLEEDSSLKLVRGYWLITIDNCAHGFSYCARSHVLIRDQRGKLRSFTRVAGNCARAPFIFVPSSRMHPELSDDQLLSGRFQLSTIVGGCNMISSAIFRTKQLWSSLERVHFCASPEEAEAVPYVVLWNFPLFPEFMTDSEKGRRLAYSHNDAAIAFGMPYRYVKDGEQVETANARIKFKDSNTMPWNVGSNETWRTEPDVWLPSTPDLIRTLEMIYVEESVPEPLHAAVLFHLYGRLSDEYIGRIETNRDKFKMEFDAKAARFS